MQVVRKLYALRFPGIDTSGMTLQQIRGMEGDVNARFTGALWSE